MCRNPLLSRSTPPPSRAIKNMLDLGLSKQAEDEALDASVERGLNQSKKGEVRPHKQVMAEIRERYKA